MKFRHPSRNICHEIVKGFTIGRIKAKPLQLDGDASMR
jgi:hypothetical protein